MSGVVVGVVVGVDVERAVLANVAYHVERFGFARVPVACGSPSLGRLVCRAWVAVGEAHASERCKRLQNAIARAGGAETLADLVARCDDAELVELLRAGVPAGVDAAGVAR